ncbi:MAG: methyltransferase domain-containing protein [Clostridiaceae bacterium]|nr:class I SAM-dependent methyltransferase [Eubacteriales bacterium]
MNALYESDALLSLTGGVLHPGGETLTMRAVGLAALCYGARILDVGCGTGAAVKLLRERGFDAQGIDASEKLAAMAASPYVMLGDGREITGRYDALLLECVLSLLGDRKAFLRSARSALLPGGKLILCEPYRKTACADALPVLSCVNGVPDLDGYRDMMEEAGFRRFALQDETDALRSFLAMLIMAFGSADAFLCQITGGCAAVPRGVRLGYAVSVWERDA